VSFVTHNNVSFFVFSFVFVNCGSTPKKLLKDSRLAAGIYRIEGSSIVINGRSHIGYRPVLYATTGRADIALAIAIVSPCRERAIFFQAQAVVTARSDGDKAAIAISIQ